MPPVGRHEHGEHIHSPHPGHSHALRGCRCASSIRRVDPGSGAGEGTVRDSDRADDRR